jgi:hypothetical protein
MNDESEAAEAEREIARRNAQLARQRAAWDLLFGAQEAGRVRSPGTQILADQRVAVGNNNADLGSEPAINLFATTRATKVMMAHGAPADEKGASP